MLYKYCFTLLYAYYISYFLFWILYVNYGSKCDFRFYANV